MAAIPSISSIQENFHSRRLLLHAPLYNSQPLENSPSSDSSLQPRNINAFDANVVMVLSVLLCALICSICLNSIIRCALRCTTFVSFESSDTSPSTILANTGVEKKALKTFPTFIYTSDLNLSGLDTKCAICLSDFTLGECVRMLPKCHHGFHVRCIDKWLSSHSSCPTCRHCLLETC